MLTTPKCLSIILLQIITLCPCTSDRAEAQTKEANGMRPFKVTIINGYYVLAYSVTTVLTNKDLKIILRSASTGAKDSTVFTRPLQFSDTLNQISVTNLNELKSDYENPCIDDGLQLTVIIQKKGAKKAVHLSNYYQEDVGKIINLVNSMVPNEYKVWYDREKLVADYKKCKGIK